MVSPAELLLVAPLLGSQPVATPMELLTTYPLPQASVESVSQTVRHEFSLVLTPGDLFPIEEAGADFSSSFSSALNPSVFESAAPIAAMRSGVLDTRIDFDSAGDVLIVVERSGVLDT